MYIYIKMLYKSGQSNAFETTKATLASHFYLFSITPTVCNQANLLGWHIALIVLGSLFLAAGSVIGIIDIILLVLSVAGKLTQCELCQQYLKGGFFFFFFFTGQYFHN